MAADGSPLDHDLLGDPAEHLLQGQPQADRHVRGLRPPRLGRAPRRVRIVVDHHAVRVGVDGGRDPVVVDVFLRGEIEPVVSEEALVVGAPLGGLGENLVR